MKPDVPIRFDPPLWGLLLLVPLILVSCATAVSPSETPPPPSPLILADPSARAIVTRLLAIQAGAGVQSNTLNPESIQSVAQDTISEELRSGKAQLAFGLGPPPEGFWAAQLGWEGILVVVHEGNPVRSIHLAQLGDVFSGKVTTWSALGSGTGAIHLVSQEQESPVRLAFDQSVLGVNPLSSEALLTPASWAVTQAVREDPLSLGYLACIDWAPGLSALQLEGVAPTGAAIQTGEYPLRIPVVAIARQQPRGTWASFLAWAQARQGQESFRLLCQP